MNKNSHHKRTNFGPGGLSCPCCRLSKSIKESRTVANRITRRKNKIELKKDVDSGESI
jgi:hypothetical protein